jgi:hypothetical protein
MKITQTALTFTAVGVAAVLLWGCDKPSEQTSSPDVDAKIDQAVEATGEAASAIRQKTVETAQQAAEQVEETADETAEQTREAVEQAGDRIESATDR